MVKKKVSKKKERKEQTDITKIARLFLIVMVMFASIVTIEIITVVHMSKAESDVLLSLDKVPVSYIKYADVGRVFKDIKVSEKPNFVNYGCEAGCNLEAEAYGKKYKYIFERNLSGEYYLSIVNGDEYIIYKENIGTSLRQAYFMMYKNYLTFVTVINNGENEYDHAIIIDDKNEIDKFSSLLSNEMEYTEDGIIYYYDNCVDDDFVLTNGEYIKAIRAPYSVDPKILESSYTNYDWCEVE